MFSSQCHRLVRNILATNYIGELLTVADISTSAMLCSANYYEALGIPKTSTQSDIKAAYYKLSMQFHPDKNKGSDSASKKFREITQAYEVLGNYKLRRLYDKGIIHTAGSQYAHHGDAVPDDEPELEDDHQTKFYKSRFRKSTVSDATGRTPIYDFDEWSRAHYGKSFERRRDAKAKFNRLQNQATYQKSSSQNEIVIFSLIFCALSVYAMFVAESSYDVPKEKAIRSVDGKKES